MKKNDIILFDKEEGVTSFSSLNSIKRNYEKGTKVGHAGTLDKFASGLMIALIGNATKLNPVFSSFDKSYLATIKFGEETDTLDPEGKVVYEAAPPTIEKLKESVLSFVGESMQTPPLYSALHINGKRAYLEARKGNIIDMPERKITVYSADLLSYENNIALCRFHVSKGTYIRSLARDIAYKANSAAHLINLRRETVGPYELEMIGKYDFITLLRMTDMFSDVSLNKRYKKQIDNGYIPKEAVIDDSNCNKGFKFLYFDSSLYAISSIIDGKMKIIFRESDESL